MQPLGNTIIYASIFLQLHFYGCFPTYEQKLKSLLEIGPQFAKWKIENLSSTTKDGELEKMLVLSRRQNEQIAFPELGITVEVLRTKGGSVRLGISAPQDVRVLRGELALNVDHEDHYSATQIDGSLLAYPK